MWSNGRTWKIRLLSRKRFISKLTKLINITINSCLRSYSLTEVESIKIS